MLYFLDTNTLIDILDGQKNVGANFIKKFADNEIKIPDTAYYEVLNIKIQKIKRRNLRIFVNCFRFNIWIYKL